jgi:hypothetical protein
LTETYIVTISKLIEQYLLLLRDGATVIACKIIWRWNIGKFV